MEMINESLIVLEEGTEMGAAPMACCFATFMEAFL